MDPFTVLIAVYHGDKFPRFLEVWNSIFTNTLLPNELVIVFDGPVESQIDELVQHAASKDCTIKLIRLDSNVGLAHALNVGLKVSSYEIIVRCDADDLNRENRFELLLSEFDLDPDLTLVGSAVTEESDGEFLVKSTPLSHHEIVRYAFLRNPFNHMTVAYKRDAVLAVGSYPIVPEREDYALWLTLLSKDIVAKNLPNQLVVALTGREMYRRRGGSGTVSKEWMLFILRVQKCNVNILAGLVIFTIRCVFLSTPLWVKPSLYKYFLRK